jgi:hypothetical protein
VSWCANEAGLLDDTIPKFASVPAGRQWYVDEERHYLRESGYEPKEGDTIFFCNSSGQNHVGIVVAYDSESNTVYTVEGNSSNQVAKRSYSMDNTYITGFGSNGGTGYGTVPSSSTDGSGASSR